MAAEFWRWPRQLLHHHPLSLRFDHCRGAYRCKALNRLYEFKASMPRINEPHYDDLRLMNDAEELLRLLEESHASSARPFPCRSTTV